MNKKVLFGVGIVSGLFTIAYVINKLRHDKKRQERLWRERINKGYRRA